MRVFYASHDQGNNNIYSKTWYNNHYLSLCDIAQEVICFDFDLYPLSVHQDITISGNSYIMQLFRPILEKELLRQIEVEHKIKPIDIFFSYFSTSYCSPEVIKKIGEMGIITINWFCNASYQFYLVKDIAPAYNYCLVPEKFRLEDYKKAGANPIYCQEAANPKIYMPYSLSKEIDVSFIGTKYGDRSEYIYSLFFQGFQVRVWGEKWTKQNQEKLALGSNIKKHLTKPFHYYKKIKPLPNSNKGEIISDEEMIKLYSKSKINLGFANCWLPDSNGESIQQVRLRDFEVPMSGGFYLTQYNKELTEFFEPDKEIVFFNNKKELIEKTKYYLNNSTEREAIRLAGYSRALKDHSWQKRFEDIFSKISFTK